MLIVSSGRCVSNTHTFTHTLFCRRAYDALNVLTAMDIIAKDKKDIQWKGFPPMVSLALLANSSFYSFY